MEEIKVSSFNKKLIVFLLAFLVISLIFGLFSWGYLTLTQAKNIASQNRTMTLSGSGKITAIPDIAGITLEIINEGKSVQTITKDNNTKMAAVIDYLKQQGVDEKDIQTSQYTITPVYEQKCNYSAPNSSIETSSIQTTEIINEGKSVQTITKDNNTKMAAVIDYLKQQGVDEKDIQTSQYTITPVYEQKCNYSAPNSSIETSSIQTTEICSPQISFYRLSQTINVKIRDFNKIDDIIGKVSDLGVNNISNLNFAVDNPEDLENQAKIQAIQNIEKRAFQFSNETGIKLGRILNISESDSYPVYQRANVFLDTAKFEVPQAPAPIEPGSLEINKMMSITYEIK